MRKKDKPDFQEMKIDFFNIDIKKVFSRWETNPNWTSVAKLLDLSYIKADSYFPHLSLHAYVV
jgi:hypothetical protein